MHDRRDDRVGRNDRVGPNDRVGRNDRVDRNDRRNKDAGSATVEFVTLGVLLLVPLVYLAVALARVQAGTLAADAGARSAARALTAADTEEEGRARARVAARLALTDQGFDEQDGDLAIRCDAQACLDPGSAVVAGVTVDVRLPGVPGGVDRVIPAHVTVRASAVAVVDEFRASP